MKLRDLREDLDLGQKDMAKILSISQTNYSKYELGKINIPIDTLKKLALFFGTSIDYILGLTCEIRPYPRIYPYNKMDIVYNPKNKNSFAADISDNDYYINNKIKRNK